MKKFSLLTIAFCLLCGLFVPQSIEAQGVSSKYTLTGKVVNNTDGLAVEMTTVRLFAYAGSDSTMVQGAQTDAAGQYLLRGIQPGQYKLLVSSIGFKEQTVSVTVSAKTAKDHTVTVKTIRLSEDVLALQEVSVQGMPPR